MKDARSGKPVVCEFLPPLPRKAILLTTPPQRAHPKVANVVTEYGHCPTIGRYGMVAEVTSDNLRQPFSLFWDRLMHAPSQLLLDLLELRPHARTLGPPFDEELPPAAASTDEGLTQAGLEQLRVDNCCISTR